MMEAPKLSSAEKLALLQAAKGSAHSTQVCNAVRGWIADPGSDRHVVAAAASLLADVGSRPEDFLHLFPRLKAAKALTNGAGLLDGGVPSEALRVVLGSSSLCTALAQRRLASAKPRDSKLLALLAVKASARDSKHLADDHPALQICWARSLLSQQDRTDLVRNLLSLRGSLTTEGSPHGDGHGQNLRLWLCLGELMSADDAEVIAAEAKQALKDSPLPATRVLVQNVWAKAARLVGAPLVHDLAATLADPDLPEAFAANCVAVAAQLLLHPGHGATEGGAEAEAHQAWANSSSIGLPALDEAHEELLASLVGWSASYVHGPRLLASLALYHAMEDRKLAPASGMYLVALERQVRHGSAFKRLRERVRLQVTRQLETRKMRRCEDWVSSAWSAVKPSRSLDVVLNAACKQVSADLWSPSQLSVELEGDEAPSVDEGGGHQRRPGRPPRGSQTGEVDVAVCASLVDNVPNMAGLVRTAEALLGSCVEVALRNDKVRSEGPFQKMVVAADKNVRLSAVPPGPRLLHFLREHRAQGKQVVALEQTSNSEILQAGTQLPKRFVLLLGSEQEGLPAWLLQSGLVDRFVELPLRGQTGSLNVHVAAAMLLWHYRLQH